MLSTAGEVRKPYGFTALSQDNNNAASNSNAPFPPSLYTRDGREKMMKWNLDAGLSFFQFKFHERFNASCDAEAFLKDLFADKSVKQIFGAVRDPLDVSYKRLHTNVLSMDFFDRLEKSGIVVGPEGYIRKCLDEDYEGLLVSDRLRDLLVNPDSESAGLFSDEEQNEFIYHLFTLLCVGGGMCQSEDSVNGYLHVTKTLYKDLMTVCKSNKSGKVEVASSVYSVNKVCGPEDGCEGGYSLFSRPSRYNRLFVIVDPAKKIATLMLHNWQPFW